MLAAGNIRRKQNCRKMKLSILGIAFVLVAPVQAWTLVSDYFLKKAASAFSVAALSATLFSPSSLVDFSGSYSDPNHPNCQRVIVVKDSAVKLSGTDGNPGCPPDGSGKAWTLTGQVNGDTILVDFSPKGGPANLKGVWDNSSPKGIKWPDGNKWTLKE